MPPMCAIDVSTSCWSLEQGLGCIEVYVPLLISNRKSSLRKIYLNKGHVRLELEAA
jgi:hypothetical protein